MLYLNRDFEEAWRGRDPFEAAEALEGQVFRSVKSRRTLRFELNGKSYFAKIHRGVGWREILKNLFMLKRPIVGARSEYEAIRKLEELGVATMRVAAFGERGRNPASRQSFIITEDLTQTESLEDFCRDWPRTPPSPRLKWALIDYVADVTRRLHENGVCHRDYYLCHFLLDIGAGRGAVVPERLRASLIDLHRCLQWGRVPRRWVVKDVGGLYFSAMDIGLTRRDLFRFVRAYRGRPLRDILAREQRFWSSVQRTARRLYAKQLRKLTDIDHASLRTVRRTDRMLVQRAAEAVFTAYDGRGRDWCPEECALPERLGGCRIHAMHMADRAGVVGIDVDGRRACGKLFYDPGIKGRLRRLLRCSKARKAFRHGERLMRTGIPVPGILGYAEGCSGTGLLITDLVEEMDTVGTALQQHGASGELLRALGEFVRRMHDAGVAHSDLSPRNVLARHTSDGWSFILLDYEDATFHRAVPTRIREQDVEHMAERFERFAQGVDPQPFRDAYHEQRHVGCVDGWKVTVTDVPDWRHFLTLCCAGDKDSTGEFTRVPSSPRSSVHRFMWHGKEYYVKEYHFRGWWKYMRMLLKATRLSRIERCLQGSGFDTPGIVCCARKGKRLLTVSEAADMTVSLGSILGQEHAATVDPDRLCRLFGRDVAHLHRAGFAHGDLRWGNVLVRDADSNSPRFVYVDNDRTRRSRRLSAHARVKNLVQIKLAIYLPMPSSFVWDAFWAGYCSAEPDIGEDAARWHERVERKTRERVARWVATHPKTAASPLRDV